MPLHVYMYAKPPDKVVRINDAYFLANTKLEDTEQCRRILRIIDQAEYCSEKTFTEGQAVLHPGVVWDPDIWDSLGVLDVVFDGNHFTDLCAISSYMQEMRCRYD